MVSVVNVNLDIFVCDRLEEIGDINEIEEVKLFDVEDNFNVEIDKEGYVVFIDLFLYMNIICFFFRYMK